jgi:hypothetical protein
VVTVQANGSGDLEAAMRDLGDLIIRYCGGSCRTGVAHAAKRTISI